MDTVRKQFILSKDESFALEMLINAGYAFPANTEVGALRKMLREAWEKTFPNKHFAQPNKEIEHEE